MEGAQPGYDQEERKGEEETGIQIAVECGPSLRTLILLFMVGRNDPVVVVHILL